jgi:nitroreductase
MHLRDALRTTGAVRGFTAEPVGDDVVAAILDDARFAPSGGNRQPWRVAVVKDVDTRLALADCMRPVWDEYAAATAAGRTPFTAVEPAPYQLASHRAGNVPNQLIDGIADVPVVLAVASDLARIAMMDKDLDRPAITGGASIYPFCWSILLAARTRLLGGVLTTFASRAERTAGPLLGLPKDHALVAVIFLGHPVQQPTKLRRGAVEGFTTVDRFDGPAFGD